MPGGEFDWGGRLRKGIGGAQRFPQNGRKPFEECICGEFWMKENEKQGGRIYGEGKREIFFFPKVRRR